MPGDRSICDIDLLINASQAVYRIVSPNTIEDKNKTSIPDVSKTIAAKNYNICSTISPGEFQEGSHVCALALEPIDDVSPIVIAFRGTKTTKDMGSNVSIALQGVAGKHLRDEAYQFYKQIRADFPGKEIVLTGHSLGGHLAQYVAAKAYADKHKKLFVRTFNSAPIDTVYGKKLEASELHRFVNFRFSKDALGKLPFTACYGDVYVLKTGAEEGEENLSVFEKMKQRHTLNRFYVLLSDDMKALQVGSSLSISHEEAAALEKMRCMQYAWFPTEQRAKHNLRLFNEHLPKLNNLLGKMKKKQSHGFDKRREFRVALCLMLDNSAFILKELSGYAVHLKDKKALQTLADDIEQLYMHLVMQDLHEGGVLPPNKTEKILFKFNEIRLKLPKIKQGMLFEGRGGTADEKTCLSSILSYTMYLIRGVLDLFTCFFSWLFTGEMVSDKNSLAENRLGRSFFFQKKLTKKEEAEITIKFEELLNVSKKIDEKSGDLFDYDAFDLK